MAAAKATPCALNVSRQAGNQQSAISNSDGDLVAIRRSDRLVTEAPFP
jgi:hypothetical protein